MHQLSRTVEEGPRSPSGRRAFERWPILIAGGAVLAGLVGGALAEGKPTDAILLCICVAGVVGLALLGNRAFAWGVSLVAVAPWYPLVSSEAAPPVVQQKVLCAAIAAAPLVPWLWSLGLGGSRTRPNRATLLMGLLYGCLAVLIYSAFGSVSQMIESTTVGFLFAGVTFLCARRFADTTGWPAAAFAGLSILFLVGLDAYLASPGNRVGYFSGHPITYGALIVGLLPLGLLYAFRHSKLLAAGLATAAAALMILSQSRSSWIATTAMLLVVIALLARVGNFRALAVVGAGVLVIVVLILTSGSLDKLVNEKLNSKLVNSQSYTHRSWSYKFGLEQFGLRPIFGAGKPGFSGHESANRTAVGALDNGYLSIAVDLGIVGLAAALIPILIALRALWRCLLFGVTPSLEIALALGIVGIAVATIFYDSFYWAQLDLLLGAMGGVLSARLSRIKRPARAVALNA